MPEDPVDADHPGISSVPCALPLPPAVTFSDMVLLANGTSLREQSRLVDVWKRAMDVVVGSNGGFLVTEGQTMFHLPSLELAENQPNPFAGQETLRRLHTAPTLLVQTSDACKAVVENITTLSRPGLIWVLVWSQSVALTLDPQDSLPKHSELLSAPWSTRRRSTLWPTEPMPSVRHSLPLAPLKDPRSLTKPFSLRCVRNAPRVHPRVSQPLLLMSSRRS